MEAGLGRKELSLGRSFCVRTREVEVSAGGSEMELPITAKQGLITP